MLDQLEYFTINEHHARYGIDQPFPVMLVVRNSTGEVRWMNAATTCSARTPTIARPCTGQLHR